MLTTLSCLIAVILIIWFKTEAILEYGSLVGLGKFLKAKQFQEKKIAEQYPLTYPRFLRMTHNNFFIRMITCAICLGVWLSIIAGLVVWNIAIIPAVCVYSLIAYSVMSNLLDHIK